MGRVTAPAIANTLSDYIAEAEQLRAENAELRRLMTGLVVWAARRQDLLADVHYAFVTSGTTGRCTLHAEQGESE